MAHTEISTPDTDHVSKKDIISIRLKHNRYTGARYETDQWLEARHNEDTGLYDVYHCEAKWTHSKSTRRFNNQYQGQSNTCVVPDMTHIS